MKHTNIKIEKQSFVKSRIDSNMARAAIEFYNRDVISRASPEELINNGKSVGKSKFYELRLV